MTSRDARGALRISAVPANYVPRYPRRLSTQEFHELIAARLPPRLHRLAAAASLAFGLQGCEPEETPSPAVALPLPPPTVRPTAPADLEAQILERIRALRAREDWAAWYSNSRFHRGAEGEPKLASPSWQAEIPIFYGNSYSGIFDVALARREAAEIFAAYGIALRRDVDFAAAAGAARIDGYDETTGLGFELRDRAAAGQPLLGSNRHMVEALAPSEHLDDAEVVALRAAGYRIHVAEPQSVFDGDDFTASMTYLAAIVDFLNEATDGPEVDLAAVLWGERQRIHAKRSIDPACGTVSENPDSQMSLVTVTAKARLVIEVAPATIERVALEQGMRGAWDRSADVVLKEPLSTAGAPTVLSLGINAPGGVLPGARRLVQPAAADGKELVVETTFPEIFVPSRFDAAKAFRIEIELEPGEYGVAHDLLVGARRR